MDIVSNFITHIRNSSAVNKGFCTFRWSNLLESIAKILKESGLIKGYEKIDIGNNKSDLKIALKYVDSVPAITEIRTVSTPGCREYCKANDIPTILGGMGVVIMSTSHGVMSGFGAKKAGVGGEILCYVW
ncbi:MAG: 30S ribosomal protein S8 [Opitutales bacterium]|nr:30S ribosomal protein S8 [Opitutales bacterium]